MEKWEVQPEREILHSDSTHISIELADEARVTLGVRSAHTTGTDDTVGLGEDGRATKRKRPSRVTEEGQETVLGLTRYIMVP